MNSTKNLLILVIGIFIAGCRQLIEIEPSKTLVTNQKISENQSLIQSALLNIYRTFDFEGLIIQRYGLYTDELESSSTSVTGVQDFLASSLSAHSNVVLLSIWKELYSVVYQANAVLEISENSTAITSDQRKIFIAEARFLRAFAYFYIVNMWGNAPIPLVSDIRITRSSKSETAHEIYKQIIADLDAARLALPSLKEPGRSRTRASAEAATTLLSRVYLYLGEWAKAEIHSTEVLVSGLFTTNNRLPEQMALFQPENKEVIFQLWNSNGYSGFGVSFIPSSNSVQPSYYLSQDLLEMFSPEDARKKDWIGVSIASGKTYYFPSKFKSNSTAGRKEYNTYLRAAELFLIRAESRLNLGKLKGAVEDLNIVRMRAGLSGVPEETPAANIVVFLEEERRRELFCENGHRFFDLKRTGRIDAVLSKIKSAWKPGISHVYPIPAEELARNPFIKQNIGYN